MGLVRSWARGALRDFIDADGVRPPSRTLPGTHALACSRYDNNYYHWHVDILPTVLFLQTKYPDVTDKVLIARKSEFVRKSLAYLGITPERVVTLPEQEAVAVERLIFASSIENHGMRMHRRVGDVFRAIKERVMLEPWRSSPQDLRLARQLDAAATG